MLHNANTKLTMNKKCFMKEEVTRSLSYGNFKTKFEAIKHKGLQGTEISFKKQCLLKDHRFHDCWLVVLGYGIFCLNISRL